MTHTPQDPEKTKDSGLDGVLGDLHLATGDQDRVSLGALLGTAGARGFGPVLIVLAFLLLLPVGLLPGMPGIVGLAHIAIGIGIILGYARLDMPRKVNEWTLKGDLVRGLLRQAMRLAAFVRPILRPRLTFLASGPISLRIIAVVLILSGLTMLAIGWIPGLPFVLSLHVLLFGLGLTARDGLAVALGYACLAPEIWLGFTYVPKGVTLIPFFQPVAF